MTSRERYETLKKRADFGRIRGAHGYDIKYQEMQATFIAHDRIFNKNKIIEPFEIIEIYNIMCKILGLVAAKNDGDLRRVENMLKR